MGKCNPDQFNQNSFWGIIDLTQHVVSKNGIVVGLLFGSSRGVFAILTSKQLSPQSDSNRKLRDISEGGW